MTDKDIAIPSDDEPDDPTPVDGVPPEEAVEDPQ